MPHSPSLRGPHRFFRTDAPSALEVYERNRAGYDDLVQRANSYARLLTGDQAAFAIITGNAFTVEDREVLGVHSSRMPQAGSWRRDPSLPGIWTRRLHGRTAAALESLVDVPEPVPGFPVATWQGRDPRYSQFFSHGGFLYAVTSHPTRDARGFGWTPIPEAGCVAAIDDYNASESMVAALRQTQDPPVGVS